ncbi:MAG: sialidase family protein [Hydrogenovibrio sp.]
MKAYPDIQLDFKLAPKTEADVYLNDGVQPLEIEQTGPFVRNEQGEIVCVQGKQALISSDEGRSWQSVPLFSVDGFEAHDSHSLCVTESGVLVLGFLNVAKRHFNWHRKANKPTKNTGVSLWSMRSFDGGYSWEEPVWVQGGYAAVTTTLIQLKSGELLMSAQNLDYDAARHYSLTFQSTDEGQSWQASNKLDIGGRGHHGGCFEGTLTELQDGRIWFLIRTNLDWFWNAYSEDEGRTWTQLSPGMEASSSPGMLCRLQSGRLLLAYNPLTNTKDGLAPRVNGLYSEVAASWYRAELCLIWSDDDGQTWSKPKVLAQCDGAWLSYCYLFEARPGEIWLTTMQSHLKISFLEKDLAMP